MDATPATSSLGSPSPHPCFFAAPADRPTVVGERAVEVLAGAAIAPRLDRTMALLFLAYDGFDWHRTFFEGLAHVPMHSRIERRGDGIYSIQPPQAPPRKDLDVAAAGGALAQVLDAAVADAIADAPRVAIAASGGLDSTAIAAAASLAWRRAGRDPAGLRLYHIRPRSGPDEVEHAGALARALGHPLTVMGPAPGDPYEGSEALLASLDFPTDGGGPAGWLRVLERMRDDGCVLLLTGDGGDEVVGPVGSRTGFAVRAARRLARKAIGPLVDRVRRRRVLGALPGWLCTAVRDLPDLETSPPARPGLPPHALARDRAIRCTRQSMIVRWQDAACRLHGLEARSPFLDLRVQGWAVALGPRAFSGEPKACLRRALAGRVPDALVARRKDQPFYEPGFCQEFARFGPSWLDRFLKGGPLVDAGLVDAREADALLRAAGAGDESALRHALPLVGLAAWTRARGPAFSAGVTAPRSLDREGRAI